MGMKRNIGYIELAVVLCLIVIIVRAWSYEKSKKVKVNPPSIRTDINKSQNIINPFNFHHNQKDVPIIHPTSKPEPEEIWFRKGLEFYFQKNYKEVIKSFDKALEINPQFTEAQVAKGKTLYAVGEYKEAIKCYDKVIAIYEAAPTLFYSEEYEETKKYKEEAITALELKTGE